MRPSLLSLLVLLFVASCARVPTRFTEAQPRDVLYSGMVGRWRGGSAAGAPAELVVVPAPDRDGLELRYRERAGTRMVERPLGHWHFGRSLDAAEWGGADDARSLAYRVVERSGGQNGAPLTLVLEAQARGVASPARIRHVIDVATGSLRLRTEEQVAGGDFMLREAYVFRRAE